MSSGVFFVTNRYDFLDTCPAFVVFSDTGSLKTSSSPTFDGSLNLSLPLLREWKRFHNANGRFPNIAVHVPLRGAPLLTALRHLGAARHRAARATASYFSELSAASGIRVVVVPAELLEVIEESIQGAWGTSAGRDDALVQATTTVNGAWFTKDPQTPWSDQVGTDGEFLAFASVYNPGVTDWSRTAELPEPMPEDREASYPGSFKTFDAWLDHMHYVQSVQIIPVVCVDDSASRLALAQRAAALNASRGGWPDAILEIKEGRESPLLAAGLPPSWWTLGSTDLADLQER
jgi:hypothetical protein